MKQNIFYLLCCMNWAKLIFLQGIKVLTRKQSAYSDFNMKRVRFKTKKGNDLLDL